MKQTILAAIALAATPLTTACTTTPSAEVTRFHLGDTSMLGRGPITIEPAQGMETGTLEFGIWSSAVAQQLTAIGYGPINSGTASGQVAQIRVSQSTYQAVRNGSPVSVGVGGATGSYGGGVGMGIGIDLSGPPANQISTELAVTIREKGSDRTVWEGRANNMVSAKSSLASPQASAQKLSAALFQGFPGNSGETITVR
ncbi:MAG: DUF4136 domain-containing protein [Novosphingobium sp.]